VRRRGREGGEEEKGKLEAWRVPFSGALAAPRVSRSGGKGGEEGKKKKKKRGGRNKIGSAVDCYSGFHLELLIKKWGKKKKKGGEMVITKFRVLSVSQNQKKK